MCVNCTELTICFSRSLFHLFICWNRAINVKLLLYVSSWVTIKATLSASSRRIHSIVRTLSKKRWSAAGIQTQDDRWKKAPTLPPVKRLQRMKWGYNKWLKESRCYNFFQHDSEVCPNSDHHQGIFAVFDLDRKSRFRIRKQGIRFRFGFRIGFRIRIRFWSCLINIICADSSNTSCALIDYFGRSNIFNLTDLQTRSLYHSELDQSLELPSICHQTNFFVSKVSVAALKCFQIPFCT